MKALNDVCLKEWSVVNRALREGWQVFLLRKGGVAEVGGRFRLEEDEFFLFPTLEHQDAAGLQERYRDWIADAERQKPASGEVLVDVYARLDEVHRVSDPARLARVLPHTVWSEDFLRRRLEYKPEEPLHLVFLRCFRTPHPHKVPDDPSYAGCTSWVKVKTPLAPGRFYPVFSPEVFAAKKKAVLDALNGP
jgi:hypothetical protein